MTAVPVPIGFQWELPPIELPVRAVGAVIVDARHMVVANCPCASYAEAVVFSINELSPKRRPHDHSQG